MLSFLSVIVCGLLELKRICVGSVLIVWDRNESVQEFYYLLGVDANLCRIFINCLEWKCISAWSSLLAWVWKRICVGSLLIVWSGNESAWFLLLVWSGCESVQDFYWLLGVEMNIYRIFIASLQWKRICAGFALLVWSRKKLCMIFIACLEWKRIYGGFVLLAWSVNEYVQVMYCVCISVSALWIQLFCLIPAYYVLVTSYALDFLRHMLWSSALCSVNWSERLLFPLLIFVVLFTITVYNYLSKFSGRNIV
jgi:hypothetical protein